VREAFGDITWEPREIVDLGDRVLVRVHLSAKGQRTALPIEEDIGHIYTLNEGKAVRLDIFRTWEEARRATGPRE
jgi:ketosteroid isomerase-like protein